MNREIIQTELGLTFSDKVWEMIEPILILQLKEAGERLRKVRDESYDQDTFSHDFNEFIELALKGELLPDYVVEKVGTVFMNPVFYPKYAAPHEYQHSDGYPDDIHKCVCGLDVDDNIHKLS